MITGEIDRIVTEYEDLWRQAAIEDRAHSARWFLVDDAILRDRTAALGSAIKPIEGSTGVPTCALRVPMVDDGVGQSTLFRLPLMAAALDADIAWRCACGTKLRPATLGYVMIHLNNQHEWTWDMFANKFRDELARGIECAQAVRG